MLSAITLSLALSSCDLIKPPAPVDARDWRDEVIYFAMTDRFANGSASNDLGPARNAGDTADKTNPLGWHGGDFAGLMSKINEGYFNKMGFTALWITPVVLQVPAIPVGDGPNVGKPFAGYHGYWAEDFFKTDPHFGTLDEYKSLVTAAHAKGLKVIQDVVVNHAGYGSKLVTDHPNWFNTDADCAAARPEDQVTVCALAGLPDFKQSVPEVTQYLNNFVTFWRDQSGIDGLRIDTMKHVPDAYWKQFFAAGGAGDPAKLWSVGEVFDGNPAYLAHFMDDLGSPSVFDFALYYAIKDQLSSAGGDLGRVADVFAQDGAYKDASRLTTFVDNHDVRRFVSEVTERGGTGAQAAERLDTALSLIFTSRGTPSVYQGSEIAQPGQGDPYNYVLGQGNREDMNFGALAGSSLDERLAALASARSKYRVLTRGAQQELWRPNGGAPILSYRRVATDGKGGQPVVVVINNGDTAVDLATLSGGGIPLLGTFSTSALTEITGRANPLSVSDGKLVGTLPPRTTLALSAPAGGGSAGNINPALPELGGLNARAGDGAVELTWTPSTQAAVTGYRVYVKTAGGTERLLNFAPLPSTQARYLATGVRNGEAATFRVVTVDVNGAESRGTSITATPSASNTVKVTFTVDARTQGNGPIELRRFDTGAQIEYPMTQTSRGQWKTDIDLPLFREIKFKFGNDGAGAKNSGYEGPGQGDRVYVTGSTTTPANTYSGTYDFIDKPVPAVIEGKVTGAGTALAGALVEATTADPNLNYALTFPDGSYSLFAPAGPQTLKATAGGYLEATRTATAPQTGADLDLTRDDRTKYAIDGNLSDWTAPAVKLDSPAEGVFGADNNWLSLQADSDAQYLYLGLYLPSGGQQRHSVSGLPDGRRGAGRQLRRLEAGGHLWRRCERRGCICGPLREPERPTAPRDQRYHRARGEYRRLQIRGERHPARPDG